MDHPTLGEIKAFASTAKHLSFVKAAAELGINPSTLSCTVRSLERRLGIRLLERTTRTVALTTAGELVLSDLQPMLANYSSALETANALKKSPAGILRLLVSPTAALFIAMPTIAAFLNEYPDIQIELSSRASPMRTGEKFDAGIRVSVGIDPEMVAVRISEPTQVITVASPQYLAKHPPVTTPKDLEHQNCIRLREDEGAVESQWRYSKKEESFVQPIIGSIIVDSLELVLAAATNGLGIARMTLDLARASLEEQRLTRLLSEWDIELDGFFLYYWPRHIPAHLKAFIEFTKSYRR
jgi:DNA-binding transcriptional LysR family regulator